MPVDTPPPVTQVPQEILDPILAEVARQSGLPIGQLTIERAEAVTWSDGSLGCPAPGEMYIQVLIDGYWVIVTAGDQTFDFRAGSDGAAKLCPPGRGRPPVG